LLCLSTGIFRKAPSLSAKDSKRMANLAAGGSLPPPSPHTTRHVGPHRAVYRDDRALARSLMFTRSLYEHVCNCTDILRFIRLMRNFISFTYEFSTLLVKFVNHFR
jgi:hypothetical protein